MSIILDTLSHLSGQLIKYLIKIFQEGKESMIKLKLASPPVRYLKDNSALDNLYGCVYI